jgi:hypothetical protein
MSDGWRRRRRAVAYRVRSGDLRVYETGRESGEEQCGAKLFGDFRNGIRNLDGTQ